MEILAAKIEVQHADQMELISFDSGVDPLAFDTIP